jgi:FecR-like protein
MHWILRSALFSLVLVLTEGEASAEMRIGGVVQRDYTGAIGIRAGQEQSERLFYDHDVFTEQRIKTDRDANTRLQFLDATELTIAGNSNVLLDRFVYDPDSGAGEAALTFGKGVFRFVTGKIKTKEAVTLKTPTATIAIRGTHLILTVQHDGSAAVAVVEGAILVQACGSTPAMEASAGSTVEIARVCTTPIVKAGYDVPGELDKDRARESPGGDKGSRQGGGQKGPSTRG